MTLTLRGKPVTGSEIVSVDLLASENSLVIPRFSESPMSLFASCLFALSSCFCALLTAAVAEANFRFGTTSL